MGVYTRNSLKNQVHQLFEKQIQTRKFLTSRAADRENIKVGIKMYSLKYALTVGQMDQRVKCLLHKYDELISDFQHLGQSLFSA